MSKNKIGPKIKPWGTLKFTLPFNADYAYGACEDAFSLIGESLETAN